MDIRIGTIVNAKPALDLIPPLAAHGFECFEITFGESTAAFDLPDMAARVQDALAESGAGISSLGVMDLEAGTFTLLDRDSDASLHEASLGWFDEDRVVICGYAADDFTQSCLYLYRF